MIDMFSNYQNLSEYYIPNNLSKSIVKPCSYTKLMPLEKSLPYELYNAKNELEGYTWNYGESITLDFTIDGAFTINSDDTIYYKPGEAPTNRTEGRLGHKIYNIIDFKSWECVAYSTDGYLWEEDPEFTYPLHGDKEVYVDAKDYLRDKSIIFKLYNFRREEIHQEAQIGGTSFYVHIDKELSKKLVKGIYYCSLEVVGENTREFIFDASDCKLLVR